jgi:hypothetical protein
VILYTPKAPSDIKYSEISNWSYTYDSKEPQKINFNLKLNQSISTNIKYSIVLEKDGCKREITNELPPNSNNKYLIPVDVEENTSYKIYFALRSSDNFAFQPISPVDDKQNMITTSSLPKPKSLDFTDGPTITFAKADNNKSGMSLKFATNYNCNATVTLSGDKTKTIITIPDDTYKNSTTHNIPLSKPIGDLDSSKVVHIQIEINETDSEGKLKENGGKKTMVLGLGTDNSASPSANADKAKQVANNIGGVLGSLIKGVIGLH